MRTRCLADGAGYRSKGGVGMKMRTITCVTEITDNNGLLDAIFREPSGAQEAA